jgi:hypothetical protein
MMRVYGWQMRSFAITVALLLAGVAGVFVCVPLAHIDQPTCDQIQPGMTVAEAEEIIGGKPGWYDGVWGIRTNSPDYKGYKPCWVGTQGEIILELDKEERIVQARFYPGQVIAQSISKMVWERLTRNAFGTGRTDLVIETGKGLFTGVVLTGSLVTSVVYWRRHGAVLWPYFVCLLGAIGSLALLILGIGVVLSVPTEASLPFRLLGGSASSLACFIVGSVLTEKSQHAAHS